VFDEFTKNLLVGLRLDHRDVVLHLADSMLPVGNELVTLLLVVVSLSHSCESISLHLVNLELVVEVNIQFTYSLLLKNTHLQNFILDVHVKEISDSSTVSITEFIELVVVSGDHSHTLLVLSVVVVDHVFQVFLKLL